MQGVVAVLSFVVTVFFIFALRPVAAALKLVDIPGGRKRHDMPVPLIGGLAMSIGLTFGATLTFQLELWLPIAIAIYLLVLVGMIDDRFDLSARVRLFAQVCAALIVVFGAGLHVSNLGSPLFFQWSLGIAAVPFTVLFVVTVINAFNVIDGLDGLAGGLSMIALVCLAIIGVDSSLFSLAIVLTAVVAGFLLFNLPLGFNSVARCFMGDAGSTFLGLAIATIGISFSQGPAPIISPVVGLWFIAVPVFDLFCSIIRRLAKGKSPFSADHDHLHHILNANGRSRRGGALIVMLLIAGGCAVVGMAGNLLGVSDGPMMLLWFAAGVLYYQVMRRPAFLMRLIRAPEEVIAQRHTRTI